MDTQTQNQPNSDPAKKETKNQKQGSDKKKTVLWIVLIVLIIVLIGVLAWWYFNKLSSKKSETIKETTSESTKWPSDLPSFLNNLEYPGSLITKVQKNTDDYVAIITMTSDDDVKTIYNYYTDLAEEKDWNMGENSELVDETKAFVDIEGDDFNTDIEISKPEGEDETTIKIPINLNVWPESLPALTKGLEYPNGKIIKVITDTEDLSVATITIETEDSVATVYDYYYALPDQKGWYLGRNGCATDESRAFVHIEEEGVFDARDIEIDSENGKTIITIPVYLPE